MTSDRPPASQKTEAFVERFELRAFERGPLAGLSFAVKDLIDVGGYKTGCGNPDWRTSHGPAVANAICVDQLLSAGATCKGTTVTDELAFSLLGENYFYGTPLNPKAPDRIPGGSSSGSASAVAQGLVDFALGTDTGGSVRVPASNCGIWGMRPTYGRISVAGVNPLAPSFDTVGAFAGSADILARVAAVLLALNLENGPKVGRIFMIEEAWSLLEAPTSAAFATIVDSLADNFLGGKGTIEKISIREIDSANADKLENWLVTYNTIARSEIWSCLGRWVETTQPQFGPAIARNFQFAKEANRDVAPRYVQQREAYYRSLDSFLGPQDLIVIPAAPCIAPRKGSIGNNRDKEDYFYKVLSLTSIAGIARLPQVSMPLAEVDGCPIGLSLLARSGQDAFLINAVLQLARQWTQFQPS